MALDQEKKQSFIAKLEEFKRSKSNIIKLSKCNLTPEHISILFDWLSENYSSFKPEILDLSGNNLSKSLPHIRLTKRDGRLIANGGQKLPSHKITHLIEEKNFPWKKIDLSGNEFSRKESEEILRILKKSTHLRYFGFIGQSLSDTTVKNLLELLENNPHLRKLSFLRNCHLQGNQINSFAALLKYNRIDMRFAETLISYETGVPVLSAMQAKTEESIHSSLQILGSSLNLPNVNYFPRDRLEAYQEDIEALQVELAHYPNDPFALRELAHRDYTLAGTCLVHVVQRHQASADLPAIKEAIDRAQAAKERLQTFLPEIEQVRIYMEDKLGAFKEVLKRSIKVESKEDDSALLKAAQAVSQEGVQLETEHIIQHPSKWSKFGRVLAWTLLGIGAASVIAGLLLITGGFAAVPLVVAGAGGAAAANIITGSAILLDVNRTEMKGTKVRKKTIQKTDPKKDLWRFEAQARVKEVRIKEAQVFSNISRYGQKGHTGNFYSMTLEGTDQIRLEDGSYHSLAF